MVSLWVVSCGLPMYMRPVQARNPVCTVVACRNVNPPGLLLTCLLGLELVPQHSCRLAAALKVTPANVALSSQAWQLTVKACWTLSGRSHIRALPLHALSRQQSRTSLIGACLMQLVDPGGSINTVWQVHTKHPPGGAGDAAVASPALGKLEIKWRGMLGDPGAPPDAADPGSHPPAQGTALEKALGVLRV